MKIIDCSPKADGKNELQKLAERAQNTAGELLGKQTEARSVDLVASHLGKHLNNKYVMLRNVPLPGLEIPVPIILIGPPGVYVIAATPVKGVYRAKDDTWARMEDKDRDFEPARPNLVQRTLHMKQALELFLTNSLGRELEMQGILVCTNPGVHVGSVRPAVRIVMTDGLERFTGSLTQMDGPLTNNDIKEVVAAVRQTGPSPTVAVDQEIRDAFAFIEEEPKSARPLNAPNIQPVLTPRLVAASNKFRLTTGQWIFVGVMLMIEIVMLMGIIMLFLRTS